MKRVLSLALVALTSAACSQQTESPVTAKVAATVDGAEAGRILAAQVRAQAAASSTPSEAPAPDTAEYKELDWLDLMPPEDLAALQDNSPALLHLGGRRMRQQGSFSTVAAVTGKDVKLPGYIVPLSTDDAGKLTEFFFVPYFGACLHAPPPPPNQIVYVSLDRPTGSPEMWNPQWLRGRLRASTTENALGGSAYVMENASLVPYEG